jgi:hypothetical protein
MEGDVSDLILHLSIFFRRFCGENPVLNLIPSAQFAAKELPYPYRRSRQFDGPQVFIFHFWQFRDFGNSERRM